MDGLKWVMAVCGVESWERMGGLGGGWGMLRAACNKRFKIKSPSAGWRPEVQQCIILSLPGGESVEKVGRLAKLVAKGCNNP